MRSHSTGFLYNPVAVKEMQHRREQEAAERARCWAAKDEVRARHWAAEDKADAHSWVTGAEAPGWRPRRRPRPWITTPAPVPESTGAHAAAPGSLRNACRWMPNPQQHST